MLKDILVNLANDDTLERDYLKVGWRDILLDHIRDMTFNESMKENYPIKYGLDKLGYKIEKI